MIVGNGDRVWVDRDVGLLEGVIVPDISQTNNSWTSFVEIGNTK